MLRGAKHPIAPRCMKIYIQISCSKGFQVKFTCLRGLQAPSASKRNLTFNLLDPDQIRLTLCYTNYRSLNFK